jgi:hypothetical protein
MFHISPQWQAWRALLTDLLNENAESPIVVENHVVGDPE